MTWFKKWNRAPPQESNDVVERPEPQIIEVGDGEEGAELVFTENASNNTPSNRFTHSPQTTIAVDKEDQQRQQHHEDESIESASSISLTKDLQEHEMEPRGKLARRLAALCCIVLVILAITLGIVLGTKDDKSDPIQTAKSGVVNEVTTTTVVANDDCGFSSELLPDGSSDVGVISATSDNYFSNGGGECGEATYGMGPGKWYKISGTGGLLSLSACASDCTVPDNALAIPEVSIFTGECDDLSCVDGVSNLITSNNLRFQAILGQDYFIYVQGGENTVGFFEVTLTEV